MFNEITDFLAFYMISEDVILYAYKIQNWTMGIACYRYNILIFAKIKFERHEISVSQIQNLKSKIQNWTTLSSTN